MSKKQDKKQKPVLWQFFGELKQLEQDDYLERMSEAKLRKLSSMLNGHISKYNNAVYKSLDSQVPRHLRKAMTSYTTSGFEQNNKGLKGWRLHRLRDKLRKALRERITTSLLLIKTQNESQMKKLSSRFLGWLTTPKENRKSARETMQASKLVKKNDKHFRMILGDQTRKLLNNFDNIVAEEYKALGFFWKTRRDDRVVGKPGGKNPKPSELHGDHYSRQDKFYFFHKNWAIEKGLINTKHKDFAWADFDDGMPGQPINCRCYAYNIYELEDVPESLLTEKGKKYLESQ